MSTKKSAETKTQSVNFYKSMPSDITITAEKIYACQFGYMLESRDEDALLAQIKKGGLTAKSEGKSIAENSSKSCDYLVGDFGSYGSACIDEESINKVTKKGNIVHYEFFGKGIRGEKAMLLIKCFSKDDK